MVVLVAARGQTLALSLGHRISCSSAPSSFCWQFSGFVVVVFVGVVVSVVVSLVNI